MMTPNVATGLTTAVTLAILAGSSAVVAAIDNKVILHYNALFLFPLINLFSLIS
jgi:hypothetical protein